MSYLEAEQAQLAASDAAGTIGAVARPVMEEGNVKLETYGKLPNNAGIDGQGGFSVTTASDNIPLLCAVFNDKINKIT